MLCGFFYAGHGEGNPDAVGGAIKSADQKIKYGWLFMV